jgi:hypothetical protein
MSLLLLSVRANAQRLRPPITYRELEVPICVIKNDQLELVYVAETVYRNERDTVLAGVTPTILFADAYPPGAAYAFHSRWWRRKASIPFHGRSYVQVGEPRYLGIGELRPTEATVWGVRIYMLKNEPAVPVPQRIAVPIRPGCVFQLYRLGWGARSDTELRARRVRLALGLRLVRSGREVNRRYGMQSHPGTA